MAPYLLPRLSGAFAGAKLYFLFETAKFWGRFFSLFKGLLRELEGNIGGIEVKFNHGGRTDIGGDGADVSSCGVVAC
jgi:hypothetical protein